jgi:hypothetical protein
MVTSSANDSAKGFKWIVATITITALLLLLGYSRTTGDFGISVYDRNADSEFTIVPKYASLPSSTEKEVGETDNESASSFHSYEYKEDHTDHIVVDDKSQHQQSIFSHPTSAAEKLQCSEKVISNVIYATDAVDECEGLRKAFDKTCSSSSSGSSSSSKSSSEEKEGDKSEGQRGRRRLLAPIMNLDKRGEQVENEFGGESFEIKFTRKLQDFYRRLSGKSSNDSKDHHDHHHESKDNEASMLEDDDEDAGDRKKHTPSLPTSNQHIDQDMLNGAVSLNEERTSNAIADEIIKNVYESKNSTEKSIKHGGKSSVESSEVSEEAIEIAAAAVDAVMNSPESIEMRTCCASIMDIYHEECDTTGQEEYDDRRLFIIIFIIAVCGLVKSLIRHFKLRWLPEAGGCILVGGENDQTFYTIAFLQT